MKRAIAVMSCLYFIITIKILLNLGDLENKMNMIEAQLQTTNINISNIQSNISSTISSGIENIKTSNKWLYDEQYHITKINDDYKSADINFSWSIKKLEKTSEVYLLYGISNEKTNQVSRWERVPAKDTGSLNYSLKLTLPLENNYKFKVLIKNNLFSSTEKLADIDFLSMVKGRIDIGTNINQKRTEGKHTWLSFSMKIYNNLQSSFDNSPAAPLNNTLKIKNISAKVYSNGSLKKDLIIMKNGKRLLDNKTMAIEENAQPPGTEFIYYDGEVEFDSTENSIEEIKVYVEDYTGRTYTSSFPGL